MSLFEHIDSDGGNTTLGHIVELLLDQRDRFKLDTRPGPFSIAELRLSEDDVKWLFKWSSNASGAWMNRLIEKTGESIPVRGESWLSEVALGFVLTVVFSEYARRYFQEDGNGERGFWACLNNTVSPRAARILFPNIYPSLSLREALCSAMTDETIHLRHRFDEQHINAWYSSLFAQFGVTRAYVTNYLRGALAGLNVGRAATYLLDVSKGPRSFTEFWETCSNYKRGVLPKNQIQHLLEDNPFVPPDWISTILRACERDMPRRNLHFPGVSTWQEFVDQPHLVWNGVAMPQFEFALVSDQISLEGMTDAHVLVGGQKVQTLLRAADSSAFEPCTPIRVEGRLMAPSITIAIETEIESAEQEVELWNEGELATLYDLETGRQLLNEITLAPNHSYAIIIPRDLMLSHSIHFVTIGDWRMYYIPKTSVPSIEVVDASGIVYLRITVAPQPTHHTYQVNVSQEPCSISDCDQLAVRLRIRVEPLADLESVRIGAKVYPLKRDGDDWLTELVELGSEWIAPKITLYAKLVGQPMAYAARFTPIGKGCLIKDGPSWRVLKVDEELPTDKAHSLIRAVGFYTNYGDPDSEPICWVDGTRILCDLHNRAQVLPTLDAYGESLCLCHNTPQDQVTLISESVTWRGILQSVQIDSKNKTVSLTLRHDTTLEGYKLVLWDLDQAPTFVPINDDNVLDYDRVNTVFDAFLPLNNSLPRIVALMFEGECHGVWWADDLPARLPESQAALSIADMLGLIRWMHLPIMRQPFSTWALECLRHSAEALKVWLADAVPLYEYSPPSKYVSQTSGFAHESWRRAVRHFLHQHEAALAPVFRKDWWIWAESDALVTLVETSPRLALSAFSAVGNRGTALSVMHSLNDFAKAIEHERMSYDEGVALVTVEEYLRADEYPFDVSILQLLNAECTRRWIVDHCLRVDDINDALWYARQALPQHRH